VLYLFGSYFNSISLSTLPAGQPKDKWPNVTRYRQTIQRLGSKVVNFVDVTIFPKWF